MQTATHIKQNRPEGKDQLVCWVLEDIKALWDKEGFGSDESVSEQLYARLNAAIRILGKDA
jgi:hypothetical protein